AFYDDVCYMLARQMGAPNSPQWFNTGLFFAYGMASDGEGHFYFDNKDGEIKSVVNAYERPQTHACFIQSVNDDMTGDGGVMDLMKREARLFRFGSGTGSNFSAIRGKGEPLPDGGHSPGLIAFLKIGDSVAGSIKNNGQTRRAAKMVCLDISHPDVEEFINWKVKEEEKVAALVAGSHAISRHMNTILELLKEGDSERSSEDIFDINKNMKLRNAVISAKKDNVPVAYIKKAVDLAAQGIHSVDVELYTTDWNGNGYESVSGQNANNSLCISNDFMKILEAGGRWRLVYRTNGETAREMDARELWDQIAYAAYNCADPGIQFSTTINEWHTCPKEGPIQASNPCSEFMFLDDTACNLASLNLLKFYDSDEGIFLIDDFIHAVRIWTIVLDISIEMSSFPGKTIAANAAKFRTLGLGYANLGALIMQMGYPYGSRQAQAITGAITALMTGVAYRSSAEIARELGVFGGFPANREDMLRVIRNHRRAAFGETSGYEGLTVLPQPIDHALVDKTMTSIVKEVWDEVIALGESQGFRNAQTSAIAPTGTIGLLMGCDTTGIEPDYALVKYKKLSCGGYFRIINNSIPIALKKLGYEPHEISAIIQYATGSGSLERAPKINHESLKSKGFTDAILAKLDSELKRAFDITFVFNIWNIGEEFCTRQLGLSKEALLGESANLLKMIGFTDNDIREAGRFICGTMTLEGAPCLKEEHLPIFVCANKCGLEGTRFLSSMDHIGMMAAAQPFVSGAISKTINLPKEATIDDIQNVFFTSWKRMLKSNSVYRDGSKLSQPLSSISYDWDNIYSDEISQKEKVKAAVELMTRQKLGERSRLPNCR
ncbi:MAG: adenosylcobalamin-dependent ribonucleoside-diphosphate reductase, partial [Oligoflexales bacterium]|nr:adenosylcobalamin-dependent ribonucleoside-diphosphate reductase [Oligoflexales bacterium]